MYIFTNRNKYFLRFLYCVHDTSSLTSDHNFPYLRFQLLLGLWFLQERQTYINRHFFNQMLSLYFDIICFNSVSQEAAWKPTSRKSPEAICKDMSSRAVPLNDTYSNVIISIINHWPPGTFTPKVCNTIWILYLECKIVNYRPELHIPDQRSLYQI